MSKIFLVLPAIEINSVLKTADDLLKRTNLKIIDYAQSNIFDLTPEIISDTGEEQNTLFITQSEDTIRMISNAINIGTGTHTAAYIGESAASDPLIGYFFDNSKEQLVFSHFIGEQIHLDPDFSNQPLRLRLGALRRDMTSARSLLSDSDFIFMNINALKWSDAPAQTDLNPSGLSSEEANQLAYMAGQSHRSPALVIYGWGAPERDPYQLSVQTALQIIWYYQHGNTAKKQPWPVPEGQYQDFVIESKMTDGNLVFRKDQITGHWYHKIPFNLPEKLERYQWISTSLEEYQSAAREDLPQRILTIYEHLQNP